MFILGLSLPHVTDLARGSLTSVVCDDILGRYLMFGQKAGYDLWFSGPWMASSLGVSAVPAQLREFQSPWSGTARRRKEEHHL